MWRVFQGCLGVLRGVTSDMTVQCCLSAKVGVAVFKASILNSLGGSIGQSRFMCQVWCSSIQGIYSWFTVGPSAKVGLSANFGVLVFKASLLFSLGGPSAKISFKTNITFYTWQIWALIVEICNCHVGVFGGDRGCQGGYIWHDCTMLTVYYPNYSQIRGNSHLFLKNPKWLPNMSHNIYPMMHLGGRSASRSWRRSANCHSWPLHVSSNVKLPFLTTRCQ